MIPLVRGATRSRSADAVLGEIRRRVAQGHREIVLTGVNLGCFRDRAAGHTLAVADPCGRRDRRASSGFGSPRSRSTTSTTSSSPRSGRRRVVGPHLHVPLQSGDDGVLRAMARRYSVETYLRKLEPLADFNLTADVIVGFPAEDERRLRADARDRARGAADEGARLPVLAPAGNAHGRRGHGAARGEEGAERPAASALRRGLPCPVGGEGRARGRRPRRPARPRLRRRLLALARRRRRSASSFPSRGARSRRRGSSLPDDCLFCQLVAGGRPRREDGRLRRDPGHQPAGGDAPAGHPRAPRRHLPRRLRVPRGRGEAHARLRRGGRSRAPGSRTTACSSTSVPAAARPSSTYIGTSWVERSEGCRHDG